MAEENLLVLGIESSCDETGVALVQWQGQAMPTLLSHALYSQIDMHQAFGGVVPELASRAGLIRQPVCIAATLSSVFLVLEAGAGRVQAFDVQGQPYFGYATGTASWFSLKDRGSTVQYLDMGVEAMGYVYVLSRINNGLNASDYNLDIYTPAGDWVCATNGFTAARMTVDLWRNVHTLNWETLRGQDGRTEPTVSEWAPGTAV